MLGGAGGEAPACSKHVTLSVVEGTSGRFLDRLGMTSRWDIWGKVIRMLAQMDAGFLLSVCRLQVAFFY